MIPNTGRDEETDDLFTFDDVIEEMRSAVLYPASQSLMIKGIYFIQMPLKSCFVFPGINLNYKSDDYSIFMS
jgi:hypothetical protein